MNTKCWKVVCSTLKTPHFRPRSQSKPAPSTILQSFLHDKPRKFPLPKSTLRKRSDSVSPLRRQPSVLPRSTSLLRREKSMVTIRKDPEPDISLLKHRYFALIDGPVHDLMAASVVQVRCRQAAGEIEPLLVPREAYTPEVLKEKMKFHLEVKLAGMKEDQKKIQMTKFAPSSRDPNVTAAFKALRAGDEATVRTLVREDAGLLTAVDAVSESTDRANPSPLGCQA